MQRRRHNRKRVIPGFGVGLGITVTMISLLVLIPLIAIVISTLQLTFAEFIDAIFKPRVLWAFWVSISCSFCAALVNLVMTETAQLLLARGITPPVFASANTDQGDKANKSVIAEYQKRIRIL